MSIFAGMVEARPPSLSKPEGNAHLEKDILRSKLRMVIPCSHLCKSERTK